MILVFVSYRFYISDFSKNYSLENFAPDKLCYERRQSYTTLWEYNSDLFQVLAIWKNLSHSLSFKLMTEKTYQISVILNKEVYKAFITWSKDH